MELLSEALSIARCIDDEVARAKALRAIADAQVSSGDIDGAPGLPGDSCRVSVAA